MADATRRVSVRLSLDDAARVKAGLREVGETGQRSLDQIKGGAERASRSLELLDVATRGIQIAGVAVAARALVQAGDALTQSLSRLQNATGSVERASAVYEALYRNALSTGVAVSESVDAFQRFSIAAREIGATSDQVVRLVTGLQRVAIVSGASTQEISSATLQLAQALASGVLQGDELRSILEAMPLLAEGLARELGVSIGELRKLGSEGKLTGELMARLPDWPARLAALLAAVETRAFDAHRWNCGRFALAAVMATTGRRPGWRSLPTLEATADSAGFSRIPPAFARPGDVVLAGDPPRLGVVVDGGRAAFVGPRGLIRMSLTDCTSAWRID